MSPRGSREIGLKLLRFVLRPVLVFALKHGLKLHDLIDCMKHEICELSGKLLEESGIRITDSRVSAMTGVHRRDVAQIKRGEQQSSSDMNLVTRIVGRWQADRRFTKASGAPRILTVDGNDSEFAQLVASESSDLRPGAVRYELERSGIIEPRRGGVSLVKGSFVSHGDPQKGFEFLERDLKVLIQAVEENVLFLPKLPHLHALTEYDRVRSDKLDEIRIWMMREGHKLHLRARELLSEYDLELNPDLNYSGGVARVALGTFSFVEEKDEKS